MRIGMRIGEVAKRLGVCTDTVRQLERRGVLAPRRDWAGHRRFTELDVARAQATLFRRSGIALPGNDAGGDGGV